MNEHFWVIGEGKLTVNILSMFVDIHGQTSDEIAHKLSQRMLFPRIGQCLSRTRAGASTRFTSTSTSTSTCNKCEYEYKYEYLIIAWVRVRVLVDEYEYKYEYRPMIYILYKQQYCIFQSLKRESSHFYNPGTKVQLPIVHVNSLCQYISQK